MRLHVDACGMGVRSIEPEIRSGMPTYMSRYPAPISEDIWKQKYRFGAEAGNEDTWQRVARAVASVELRDADAWQTRFAHILSDYRFLPGGRILANAGTDRMATLLNCFVMGVLDDSIEGLFTALRESAITLQQGGGIGLDFSPIRPAGSPAQRTGNIASGPVSFMQLWDAMCETVTSDRARRGAMMAVLRCDHPDIEAFIDAKREGGRLSHFNLSVLVTDDFVRAVDTGADWPLKFRGETVRVLKAADLWERLLRAGYESGEPGVLFIDRINDENNLGYAEQIFAANPCGEVPLPPYGACDLGSVNLTRFVNRPFASDVELDFETLAATVHTAVRFLDNVLDASHYPLAQQAVQAAESRRIGLGVTGLADALIMLGIPYGSVQGRRTSWRAPSFAAFQRRCATASARAEYATATSLRSRRRGRSACSPETCRPGSNPALPGRSGASFDAGAASLIQLNFKTMLFASGRSGTTMTRCPRLLSQRWNSCRTTILPCRQRHRASWTMPSPRQSMCRRAFRSRHSGMCIARHTNWALRAVPSTDRAAAARISSQPRQGLSAFPAPVGLRTSRIKHGLASRRSG